VISGKEYRMAKVHEEGHILMKNANLFDAENGVLRSKVDILIEGDRIKEVGKIGTVDQQNLTEIDCSGKYVLPGLFECHAHLALLTSRDGETRKQIMKDFRTSEEDELERRVLREFVIKGITQIRDVGGPLKTLRSLKARISEGELIGPDLFYAGPMLEKSPLVWEENNKFLPGFTVAVDSKQDAASIIEQISKQGASLVKTFNKFDADVFRYLLDAAKEHNLPVTHDPGTTFFQCIPMTKGIDSGIRCFEHGKAPWPVVLKNDLKSEHDSLMEADPKAKQDFTKRVFSLGAKSVSLTKLHRLFEKMVRNDVYCCVTLHAFKYMQEQQSTEPDKGMLDKLELLDQMQYYFVKKMTEQNVKVLIGQDGLMPEFTFQEMRHLKEVGLPEAEIIRGATIYPARWLGVTDTLGSISPEKKANVLILSKNPLEDIRNIDTACVVLKSGEILFQERRLP
jgi:imidazolonepropionase-like amidohydrolase